jgi:nucleobase:cation symporter-1, NCS1 family
MSAYAVFLGPIASIMVMDFYVIHKRKYDTLALFQPYGIYRYSSGINWRAIIAFIVGVTPTLPGLINSVNPNINVGAGVHPYQFGWILGFVGSAIVYLGLSYIWPPHETFIDRAVYPDEIYEAHDYENGNGNANEIDGVPVEYEAGNGVEKSKLKSWADRLL